MITLHVAVHLVLPTVLKDIVIAFPSGSLGNSDPIQGVRSNAESSVRFPSQLRSAPFIVHVNGW